MQPDIQALALTKAIRQKESGGNYKAVGDAGTSTGAFQYQEATWKAYAKDVLGDGNAPMTEANQNAVTYGKIKQWKDVDGLGPAEIAGKWNSGSAKGWENKAGTTTINGKRIAYDTPTYVKDVLSNFKTHYDTTLAQYGNTEKPASQGTFNVPNTETSAQKIARYNNESATLQKEADKANSVGGFLGNAGKAFTGMVASSEVALGNTLGKIFGQDESNAQNQASIQDTDTTQANLLKLIRQNESKGIDSTKLKRLYNDGEKQRQSLQASSDDINTMPTTGQAVGQLAGTALDVASFGTYGAAAKGMKSFQLAEKALPSVAGLVTKPTGFFTKKGLAKTAEGAGLGLGYGVTQGMQDGDINPYHVALSTVIGGGLPALAEFGATGKGLLNKETKGLNMVAKRESELNTIVSNNSTLRKVVDSAEKNGYNPVKDLANSDLLVGTVNKDGVINKQMLQDRFNMEISGTENVIKNNFEKTGERVHLDTIKRYFDDILNSDYVPSKSYKQVEQKYHDVVYGLEKKGKIDENGMVKFADVQQEKIDAYKLSNFLDPEKTLADKAAGKAFKRVIDTESSSVANLEAINKELGQYLSVKSLIDKLGDKKVKGGRLGKYFAQSVGAIAGHSVGGPVGAIAGAEFGGQMQGQILKRTFGKATGKSLINKSQILEDAISTGGKTQSNQVLALQIPQATTITATNIGIPKILLSSTNNSKAVIAKDALTIVEKLSLASKEDSKIILDTIKESRPQLYKEVIETQNKARYDKYQSMKDKGMTEKMTVINMKEEPRSSAVLPESLRTRQDQLEARSDYFDNNPMNKLRKYESKSYPGELPEVNNTGKGKFNKNGDVISDETFNTNPDYMSGDTMDTNQVSEQYSKFIKEKKAFEAERVQLKDDIRSYKSGRVSEIQSWENAANDHMNPIERKTGQSGMIKIGDSEYDRVAKALTAYDVSPATVNGKIEMANTTPEFRLMELQDKLNKNALTPAEMSEARDLLESRGALSKQSKQGGYISTGNDADESYQEAKKFKSAEEFVKANGGVGDSIANAMKREFDLETLTTELSKKANSFSGKGGLVTDTSPEYLKVKTDLNNVMREYNNFKKSELGKIVQQERRKLPLEVRMKMLKGDIKTKSQLEQIWKDVNAKTNPSHGKAAINPLTVGAGVAGAVAGSMAMSKKEDNK